jgi:pantoate--beta-alanine ligase
MPSIAIPPATPTVVKTARETYELVRAQQAAGKRVGLVPTMGALHAGHLSLVERSARECDFTVVTIFVNPKQFSPQEDFSKYPRTLESDLERLSAHNVPVVFAPSAAEMYPAGFATTVDAGPITKPWEGVVRPDHFRGVTTVVLKLFQIAPADRAYFGRKDYQQAQAIRRMAADLNLPIEIVVCPLVRDADGLALSSRNAFLSAVERQHALVLSRSLRTAREMFAAGERDATKIQKTIVQLIEAEPGVKLDYVAVVEPDTLAELKQIDITAVALVAARVGATRLIDNEVLGQLDT